MRGLLFKGKRKDTGEWTEGYFFKIWDRVFLLWGMTGDSPNMEEVIPETVEQCTDLSEKVEEIKKALQDHSIEKLKYQDGIKIKELGFFDILTYINELESENKSLQDLCNKAYWQTSYDDDKKNEILKEYEE